MRDFALVTIVFLMILALCGCKDPVRHGENAESYLKFHTENDDLTKAGVREIDPGVYLKKIVLGNDVIYLRCDKDGNILSHNEINLTVPSGKTTRSITII